MNLNKTLSTDLIKEIEKKYPNAVTMFQDIWMHATEFLMDDTAVPPVNKDELAFLEYAYSVIKLRGEQLCSYSKDELFQVHTMLVSSIFLDRGDLINKSGLGKEFVFVVESKLEELGYSFI